MNKSRNKNISITYEDSYNGLPIHTNKDKELGCYTKILDRLQKQTEYMVNAHSKVFQVRLDIRYPQDYPHEPSQKDFSKLNKNLKRNFERNNKIPQYDKQRSERKTNNNKASNIQHKVDPTITLVIEHHGQGTHSHAHAVVQVNGNAKRNAIDIQKRAKREWATVLGIEDAKGLVHYCDDKENNKPGSYMIDRNKNFEATSNDAFHQASYLAKERGKYNKDKGKWIVTGTRIPKK